jgi:hypothetical protein
MRLAGYGQIAAEIAEDDSAFGRAGTASAEPA